VDDDFDFDRFYKILLEDFKTYVGPGYWFSMPKWYFRIGFSWPEENQLREGLSAVSDAIREVVS
jgi:DNA-binding transcriptional MocR family regulator